MGAEALPESKRVMLVEDDGGMIRSVREAIEGDPRLRFVGYLTGRANLDPFLGQHTPDVALVDVGLMRPGDTIYDSHAQSFDEGLWIIAHISQHSPRTKVVGFSSNFITNASLVQAALNQGADALIAKQSGPSDWPAWGDWLCSQLHAVVDNWWRPSPEIAQLVQSQISDQTDAQLTQPPPLTTRQIEVIHCLAAKMSDRKIAQALTIEEGAVRNHIANIRKRLAVKYRWQIVDEARRHGITGNALDDQ